MPLTHYEVPRIEYDVGWTYFITRAPDVGDDFNDYTTPIFALGKNKTVTLSRDPLGHVCGTILLNVHGLIRAIRRSFFQ